MAGSAAAIMYGFRLHADEPTFLAVLTFWCLWSIVALSRFTLTGLFSEPRSVGMIGLPGEKTKPWTTSSTHDSRPRRPGEEP
jgi:hypothetical protein